MEDEGFVDDDFIEDTAREYIGRYGFGSIRMLRERARIAEKAGNDLLAQACRDAAVAAERILWLNDPA